MKKIFLFCIVFFLIFPTFVLSEKSETEKQNQTEIYAAMWLSYNDCWYNIDQEMTDFANQYVDEGKVGAYETHQLGFWEDLTAEVTAKFPDYDYSKCIDVTPEDQALEWKEKNTWFMVNDDMTDYAYLIHGKLIKQGIDPIKNSKVYYGEIDKQMRMKFPNYDWE